MMNKRIAVAVALVVAVVCLAEAREEGPSAHEMADALRVLQELDRYYTQAARPRIDRRDVADGDRVDPQLLDRAMRLIQLQNLDRIYSYHTRPRFGKRSEAYTNWAKDMEKPDLPAWLSYARRR
uniref:Neuropeptide F1 splicing variant b n=1 Tax=Chilo suppressalis TaxID=168631 RepID=A0A0S1U0I9_CHISP|nr:neuropeptide F1 precursor splicing variant b [Chilo suppressalis]